jgi:cell wall assembly regulator SMI1
MSALTDALERILTCLQQRFYDSARMFEPGLSYKDIEQRVKKLPFKLPKEVYELYQWRNGTYYAEEDRAGFFDDGLVFLSLEAAINKCRN